MSKKSSNKRSNGVWKLYKVVEGKITSKRTDCPKCGHGVFLAEHNDRFTCGRCGYTKFKA